MPIYLLVDNGSKQPQATLRLRELASALSALVSHEVHAVSLQHADVIAADKLEGTPANTFGNFLRRHLQDGEHNFVVLPLFFGVSRALTSFIPQQIEQLQQEFDDVNVTLADVIYPLPQGDDRLAQIMFEHINSVTAADNSKVVLVDHGSPVARITEVRQRLAATLRNMYGKQDSVDEAVMERREGKEYDFNGELLEDWLRKQAQEGVNSVIIAMLFFLPGRHAGSCGDVESICQGVVDEYPTLEFHITPLISEHPLLLTILKDRLMHAYPS